MTGPISRHRFIGSLKEAASWPGAAGTLGGRGHRTGSDPHRQLRAGSRTPSPGSPISWPELLVELR